jgi:hypothetical protein
MGWVFDCAEGVHARLFQQLAQHDIAGQSRITKIKFLHQTNKLPDMPANSFPPRPYHADRRIETRA